MQLERLKTNTHTKKKKKEKNLQTDLITLSRFIRPTVIQYTKTSMKSDVSLPYYSHAPF